jgi:competence protein ComEA
VGFCPDIDTSSPPHPVDNLRYRMPSHPACNGKLNTFKERIMSIHRSVSAHALAVRRSVQALICSLLPAALWAGPVDINTADAATIAKELQGIGLSKAQDIVQYREKNGAFKSADDLRKIKGIGAKTLERNRVNIRMDSATAGARKGG